jgi:hypothetical protein
MSGKRSTAVTRSSCRARARLRDSRQEHSLRRIGDRVGSGIRSSDRHRRLDRRQRRPECRNSAARSKSGHRMFGSKSLPFVTRSIERWLSLRVIALYPNPSSTCSWRGGDFYLERELRLQELLSDMIDKCMKRLIHAKGLILSQWFPLRHPCSVFRLLRRRRNPARSMGRLQRV